MARHDAIEGSSIVTVHVSKAALGSSKRICKTCGEPLVQITTEGAYPVLKCMTGHVWWLNPKTGKVSPYTAPRIPP